MVDGVLPHHDVMLLGAGLVSHLREIHATKNCFMDVCPDNIIIIPSTEKGQLIDFGIVHEFSCKKLYGICPPRLLYASRELLSPPPYRVVALHDIWSLFWTLYTLWKGTAPGAEHTSWTTETIIQERAAAVKSFPSSFSALYQLLSAQHADQPELPAEFYDRLIQIMRDHSNDTFSL
jgi:serine/threonine protein kinase